MRGDQSKKGASLTKDAKILVLWNEHHSLGRQQLQSSDAGSVGQRTDHPSIMCTLADADAKHEKPQKSASCAKFISTSPIASTCAVHQIFVWLKLWISGLQQQIVHVHKSNRNQWSLLTIFVATQSNDRLTSSLERHTASTFFFFSTT